MNGPNYSVVCGELHAARQHLYDMVRGLTQDELSWVPARHDGASVSYHFGHMALVEDQMICTAASEDLIAGPDLQSAFGAHNANAGQARLPSGATIIDYMQRVRERTLGLVAMRFRAIHSPEQAVEAADLFRRIINHDYMHTKYIRRICREMGKPDVDAPTSRLIIADADAMAGPQYRLEDWAPSTAAVASAPLP